jgi:hypothetical protein
MSINRRNFLKTLGIGLAYACTPVVFIKEKAAGWLGITNGSFSITVDGEKINMDPLDFSGLDTFNPIDEIIAKSAKKHFGDKKLEWKPGDFGHFEFK